MNWKLVFLLSLLAVVIAFVSVFVHIAAFEMWLWLVLFIFSGFIIARKTSKNRFGHGFILGILCGIWKAVIHYSLFDTYIVTNAATYQQAGNLPQGWDLRTVMLVINPIIGIFSGLVAGLIVWAAGMAMKNK